MILYTKQELKTLVTKTFKGCFKVNHKEVKCSILKNRDGMNMTKVKVDDSYIITTEKKEIVDFLYEILNAER